MRKRFGCSRELYGELKEHGKTDMSKGDDRFRGIERLLEKCDSNKDGKYDREEVKVLVVDYYNECDEIDKLLVPMPRTTMGAPPRAPSRSIAQDFTRRERIGLASDPAGKSKFAVFEFSWHHDKNVPRAWLLGRDGADILKTWMAHEAPSGQSERVGQHRWQLRRQVVRMRRRRLRGRSMARGDLIWRT